MSDKNKEVEKVSRRLPRSAAASLPNPRIVRAPRDSGGKDRHSKVCTVRGLRDRRIRLSVPTAIQLYDLQERLGVSQPSKVVDWLLHAAKDDVDRLPPLPAIPGLLPPPPEPAFAGFQNFFPTGSGPSVGYNGNNANCYLANWDPAGLSLARFGGGFGSQPPGEEKFQGYTSDWALGSGSGPSSHPHHHHQLY